MLHDLKQQEETETTSHFGSRQASPVASCIQEPTTRDVVDEVSLVQFLEMKDF